LGIPVSGAYFGSDFLSGVVPNIKATIASKAACDPTSRRSKGCKLIVECSHFSDIRDGQRTGLRLILAEAVYPCPMSHC